MHSDILNEVIDFNYTNEEYIAGLDSDESCLGDETFYRLFNITNPLELEKYKNSLITKAKTLGVSKSTVIDFIKAWKQQLCIDEKADENYTQFPTHNIVLRCGDWIADTYGVKKTSYRNDNHLPVDEQACPHPILISSRITDTNIEKVEIEFFKDYKWRSVVVDKFSISDKNQIIKTLSNIGVEVNSENARNLIQYLADLIAYNRDIIPLYAGCSKLGWHKGSFIPYDENIKFTGQDNLKSIYDDVTQKGSYDLYKQVISETINSNTILKIMYGTSLASPLCSILDILPFITHVWGESGTCKSVALMLSMSIWGNPTIGNLVRTMKLTDANLESIAECLNNVPFAGDELQLIKSEWRANYDDIIYFTTEGSGKGRNKTGENVERLKTWCNTFLFSGEEPIIKTNSGAGANNRVIELFANEPLVIDGNFMSSFVKQNYGHVGKEYIEVLKKIDKKKIKKYYLKNFEEINQAVDTTEKQAMAMAAIITAYNIASKYIFTDEYAIEPLTVNDVIPYLKNKNEIDIVHRAYQWTLDWISKNSHRYYIDTEDNTLKTEIWGKIERDYVMINKTVYSDELKKQGYDLQVLLKEYSKRGWIIKNSENKNVHCTKINGIKNRFIKLSTSEDFNVSQTQDLEF